MRQHTKVSELPSESFEVDRAELSNLLYGSKENYETFSKIEEECGTGPLAHELDRHEAFRINLERARNIREKIAENGYPRVDYMNNQTYGNLLNGMYPTSLSHAMFEALVRILGDDRQSKAYLEDILDEKIVGCYAQTELGHGSDVQSLQTQAKYDPITQQFVVNTPSVTAIKFWPGDLGKMANHVVFHGRLISQGKDHGVHAFF